MVSVVRRQHGFTLIEVLFASTILALFVIMIFSLLQNLNSAATHRNEVVRLASQSQAFGSEISSLLRLASRASVVALSANELQFRLPPDANRPRDGQPTEEATSFVIKLDVEDENRDGITNQIILQSSDLARPIANYVAPDGLHVRVEREVVQVDITLEGRAGITQSRSIIVYPRNP